MGVSCRCVEVGDPTRLPRAARCVDRDEWPRGAGASCGARDHRARSRARLHRAHAREARRDDRSAHARRFDVRHRLGSDAQGSHPHRACRSVGRRRPWRDRLRCGALSTRGVAERALDYDLRLVGDQSPSDPTARRQRDSRCARPPRADGHMDVARRKRNRRHRLTAVPGDAHARKFERWNQRIG